MKSKKNFLNKIKAIIQTVEPKAKVILYGSRASGKPHRESDWDLLILVNKDKLSFEDEKKISYPLYDLEFETGEIISPNIFCKMEWETIHKYTPLYQNIKREGIVL